MKEVTIPQIKTERAIPEGESPSILVPKIDTSKNIFSRIKIPGNKVFLGILVALLVLVLLTIIPGLVVYKKAQVLGANVNKLNTAGKSQDLVAIKTEITNTKNSLKDFKGALNLIIWTKYIPFLGSYVSDAEHAANAGQAGLEAGEIVLTTIDPYADLLGLKGAKSKVGADGAKTTQERIDFIIKTIPSIIPKLDEISAKVKVAKTEIDKIDPDRYPEKFRGKPLRHQIRNGQEILDQVSTFVIQGKPLLQESAYLLGIDSPRKYLILFQNDKELRPTGGFMTAYATMKVDKGHFEPTSSSDIYNLDAVYKPQVPAPGPIVKYIKGPYIASQNLRLRDMNWSPDFPTSMKLFTDASKQAGVGDVDGVIAVDTQLLVNLLGVIGQIGVPGFGNFSTNIVPECNCPQVIHELEAFADVEGPIVWDPVSGKIVYRPPNSDNRKKIIGPLMNSILANAMGQPKNKLPALFEAGFRSLMEKHVLFYLYDVKAQSAVSDFGLAGTIKSGQKEDYLHINDANLGGRKSNLYVTQEVTQEISVQGGAIEKTVTITYKNPEKQDGWLNSVLPDWVRIYVPKESQLIASEGLDDKAEPYEDLGKEVFAGLFKLRPQGVAKVTFKYKLPSEVSNALLATKEYSLLIQKQPGVDAPRYSLKLGRHEEEFTLTMDKDVKIRF